MTEHITLTQEEYDEAVERGNNALRAVDIVCFPRKRLFQLELINHTKITFSADLFPDLKGASTEQIAGAKLMFDGTDIWWHSIDVQHSVEYIASKAIQVTTAREAARRAASVISPRKAAAARANGRLGGRPRKKVSV